MPDALRPGYVESSSIRRLADAKSRYRVGIAGAQEPCCGGRAYEMGYKADFLKQAERNMELIKQSGAKILVTGCAECYYSFKVLYDKFNLKGSLEVLHTAEYFDRLIKGGKIKPHKKLDLKVTYHDPCTGRAGGTLHTLAGESRFPVIYASSIRPGPSAEVAMASMNLAGYP